MVYVGVFRVAFGALGGDIGDAVPRVGACNEPPAGLDGCEHLLAKCPEFARVLQSLEEEVSFLGDAATEFARVIHRVV